MLTEAEVSSGRVGNIDFSKAKRIAQDFKSIIRVANNMEGAQAISEEFSHLVVALFKQEPLTVRALNTLKNNEDALKQVLKIPFCFYLSGSFCQESLLNYIKCFYLHLFK